MRPFAAAAAVFVLLAAGCGPSDGPADRSGPGSAPALASVGTCQTGLPGADAPPPPLPADRAVGRGVLVYRPCADCGAWLVTESGERYDVPAAPEPPTTAPALDASPMAAAPPPPPPPDPMFGLRLSPDGRWLARSGYGGLTLRDLTGTGVQLLGTGEAGAWSADGRFLVVDSRVPGTDTARTELVEVATGARWPVRLPWGEVLAVLGRHEVLVARMYHWEYPDPDPERETFAVVDPATGRIRREVRVDFGAPQDTNAMIAGAGLIVGVNHPAGDRPAVVVTVALDTGRVLGRHPLPAETPAGFGFWQVAGVTEAGVSLLRDYRVGSPSPRADPVQLFWMDPVTGARRAFCTLPGGSELIIRH